MTTAPVDEAIVRAFSLTATDLLNAALEALPHDVAVKVKGHTDAGGRLELTANYPVPSVVLYVVNPHTEERTKLMEVDLPAAGNA